MSNKIDNKIPQIDLNYTKKKNYSDYYDMSNITVNKKISIMENKQFNYSNPNYFKKKCLNNNIIDNNHNIGNKLDNINL